MSSAVETSVAFRTRFFDCI